MSDPSDDPRTSFALLGNPEVPEMAAVRAWLKAAAWNAVDDLALADVVVVGLDHPDRYSKTEVERLIASAPLARWVVCCGTWCESIGRNRDAWPGGARIPMRLAIGRLDREAGVLRGTRPPLPLTASRDETWIADHVADDANPNGAVVRVDSPDRPLAETWRAILGTAGFQVLPATGDAPHDCLLFDGDPWCDATRARLAGYGAGPVVVARTMPPTAAEDRPGSPAFLPKLAPNAMLLAAVERAVRSA